MPVADRSDRISLLGDTLVENPVRNGKRAREDFSIQNASEGPSVQNENVAGDDRALSCQTEEGYRVSGMHAEETLTRAHLPVVAKRAGRT